jgi:UDP-2-acetamido-2-deoxy-ribo-hexuluronate aminotransferase
MDLLLDVDIVIDICQPRSDFSDSALKSLAKCHGHGGRIWLYAGSVQTLEYSLAGGLIQQAGSEGLSLPVAEALRRSRLLIYEFARDKHWLAALASEGDVFLSDDPEDEQLIRALERFEPSTIRLLTRDKSLLGKCPAAISPDAYLLLQTGKKSFDFIDLKIQQDAERGSLEKGIHRVLHHGQYIMGPEIKELETHLAAYVGAKHCITCSSGTDALLMALMALDIGPGDEVITVPYTWISTAEVIALIHAKPVFVDIQPDTFNMDPDKLESAITPRTKAIMPVGIYGQCADMTRINAIADKHGIPVIEDAAQCFGATHHGKKACNLSLIGCTSFFPSKPLGCYGDGGAIFTPDDALADKLCQIRIHGQKVKHQHPLVGINGRLDTIQAAILLEKFSLFPEECRLRAEKGNRYNELLSGIADIKTPVITDGNTSVYAQYTILSPGRDTLSRKLQAAGIPSVAYYTAPLHLQGAFAGLGYKAGDFPVAEQVAAQCLSLPMSPYLNREDQDAVASAIRSGN